MRSLVIRGGLLTQLCCLVSAVLAGGALAEPGSGPRGTVDQTFTTTAPASPTGIGFTARYHAEGDPNSDPPFMERMVFFPPEGMRYDTRVPDACTASDLELQASGPAACPEGSRLGGGTTQGVFFVPFTDRVVLDRYTHNVYVMNNVKEQIVLVEAEGYSVLRGRFKRDGSLAFELPTCFPTPPTGECVEDHVLQTATSTFLPEYTRTVDGEPRSYATTPPACPASGYWETRVRLSWSTGDVDDVVTRQPCA
ncbi:MAG: hypothetical protein M3340_04125 [Actinomycetota bacterium]|nr:hypothetical protein [Actinomycetota bacterium]